MIIISQIPAPTPGPGPTGGGGGSTSDSRPLAAEEPEEEKTPTPTITETCVEDWICSDWFPRKCPLSEIQTRKCEDQNRCGTTTIKPIEERTCEYVPIGVAFEALGEAFTGNLLLLLLLLLLITLIIIAIIKREQIGTLFAKTRSKHIERLIHKTQLALNQGDLKEAHRLYTELSELYNKHPEHIKSKYYQTSYALYRQLKKQILKKRR